MDEQRKSLAVGAIVVIVPLIIIAVISFIMGENVMGVIAVFFSILLGIVTRKEIVSYGKAASPSPLYQGDEHSNRGHDYR